LRAQKYTEFLQKGYSQAHYSSYHLAFGLLPTIPISPNSGLADIMHAVLQTLMDRISREIDGLADETMQLHPDGNVQRWSPQQLVEHLVLTYRMATRNLEAHLAKGRVTRSQDRSRVEWTLQLMVLSFGYYPGGVPPVEETSPKAGLFRAQSGRELAELLEVELEAMDAALDRCRRKFGMERVAVHPMLGPLRVDQWRRFHVVHGMHYLKQLIQVRDQVVRKSAEHGAGQDISPRTASAGLREKLPIPAHRSLT
jgi:hypothetical protein